MRIHRTILTAASVALSLFQIETGSAGDKEVRISIDYGILAVFAAPGGPSGVGRHHLTITLKPNKEVSELYEGGGKYRKSSSSQVSLGGTANAKQYRVVDANTITRISDSGNFVTTITIHVAGKTCSIDLDAKLKPGEKYFGAYSQGLGRMAQYQSLSLAYQTCRID